MPLPYDLRVLSRRGETDLLAVGLLGDVESHPLGDGPDRRLLELTDGEQHVVELGGREPVQEVGLVLGRIDAAREPRDAVGVTDDSRVVPGRKELGTLNRHPREQVGELQAVVAHDARVRRTAPRVGRRELRHHLGLERVPEVQRVVGDAEQVAHAAGIANGRHRAAAALDVAGGPQLHRDTRDVVALLDQKRRSDA